MTELIAFAVGFIAGVWPVVLIRNNKAKPVDPVSWGVQRDGTFKAPPKKKVNPFGTRAKQKIPFGL